MKKASFQPLLDSREIDELVLKILSRNPCGLTADKIRKDLPPSHRRAKEYISTRLDYLSAERRVHAWHPGRGEAEKTPPPVYSLEPLEPIIRREIMKLLKDQTLTPAQIKKTFPSHIHKYLLKFLEPLLNDGIIKWHPPLKGKRLGLQEPDPGEYLKKEIHKLFARGEQLGFQRQTILRALGAAAPERDLRECQSLKPEEAERAILQTMKAIKPAAAQGALVYIPELREALRSTFPDKNSFDEAMLTLAKKEKVQLQSHSLPAELTEEQRQAMIDNQRGSYFMAVGIRME